jgi:hypothetical protein
VFFHSFSYRAASWKSPRRVIAKMEWHLDELFPRVGFIVTNMTSSPQSVVHFYNRRGTCEQWIKEGKLALIWTRLSCPVLLQPGAPCPVRAGVVSHWSLSSIQLKLIKIGAKIVSHSRRTVFQMAEVAVPEKLFRSMLSRIHRLGRACARTPALSL